MEETSKSCSFCKTAMVGRADKKYCSNQCRAMAGNHRKMHDPAERLIKDINVLLRRNRDLLSKASPVGKTTLRKSVLELSGFNFNYYTHVYRTRQNTYYFCYDYGFRFLDDEKVMIVNWQPYMEKS